MSRRYRPGMLYSPIFIAFQTLLLAGAAQAQDESQLAVSSTEISVSVTASAHIIENPVRIVAADLARHPDHRPAQSDLVERPCDPGAPPGCRLLVVELP